jgi:hypothetical protein
VTRLENGLPGAVVHGCFHKRLFFRVLFISPVFLDDCAHPRDFPANPRNPSSTWRRPMDSLRESRATRLEVRGISPEPCVRPFKLLDGPPNDCSRSLAFVWGDGKVARVGWKIARVSSAISPHASAITPRSATFARHASATAPPSAIIERLEK